MQNIERMHGDYSVYAIVIDWKHRNEESKKEQITKFQHARTYTMNAMLSSVLSSFYELVKHIGKH